MSRILFAATVVAVAAAAGCGGEREEAVVAPRAQPQCADGAFRPLGSDEVAYAAVVRRRATAFRDPGRGRLATFGRVNVNRVPTVLGVRGEVVGRDREAAWYRVQLPLRPNGIVGYVRASDVAVAPVRTRIVVDLSERRVTLYDGGRALVTAPAAVGSPRTPTPVGRFYVNQRLIPANPDGPYGPGAIGISAYSDVLTGWAQGGPIAIHGTNEPSSIGRAVSNGCIRVPNPVVRRLFRATLAGTPVLIRA